MAHEAALGRGKGGSVERTLGLVPNDTAPLSLPAKFHRPDILGAVQHAQDHDAVGIAAEIDAAVAVGQAPQAFGNVVARRAGEVDLGDPCDLGGQVR